jgi:integrase
MSSIKKRGDGKWRARFRDEAGREHARHFARKTDAQRWLDEVTTSIVSGTYVDPKAGQVTFRVYAEQWRVAQVHRPSTRRHVETMLRRHAYPTLGDKPLSSVLPSDVQTWVRRLGDDTDSAALAPRTIGVLHSIVSSVLRAAVRDRRIVANPCDGTRLPKPETRRVEPLSTEQVAELTEAMPAQYRALVTLAAGTGMRQGECFGLTVDRVDFLRRSLTVDRQLVTLPRQAPFLAPPKTKASVRTIPLPNVVVEALSAHLVAYRGDGYVFTMSGGPINRPAFGRVWRAAIREADLPHGTGFHALRHYYASLLIRHGESVKTVQARLGHASATETLDTYSHLWPDSDDRTREAIDTVLGAPADSLRTEEDAK